MRNIPATMVSQHPDHASTPYWHNDPYIRVHDEIYECYDSFFHLGVSEYKWDWEGKFVDEAVVERMMSQYYNDFKEHPLGKEKFLTFRLPNPHVETEFRLGRAFFSIFGAAGLAEKAGLHSPPMFEVIIPMAEEAAHLIDIQEAFLEISTLKHPLLKVQVSRELPYLEIIPLFEQIDVIADSVSIIEEYVSYFQKTFKKKPEYIRPYVARSDPALNAGVVPTVLAIKIALSRYQEFAEKSGIDMYPIIGSASLPFRGSLTPYSVDAFTKQYSGIRTTLLQSAFRYDYPLDAVKTAIDFLEKTLPELQAESIPEAEIVTIRKTMKTFEAAYQVVIEDIAEDINAIASKLPKRRERVQHIGLFGYSRGIGKVKLPRAIGFTAALYSLGVPPELIGTGRGLKKLIDEGGSVNDVHKYYPMFEQDMAFCMRHLNKNNLDALAKKGRGWQLVREDVEYLQSILQVKAEPQNKDEEKHLVVTSQIMKGLEADYISPALLEEAGKLRKSLG